MLTREGEIATAAVVDAAGILVPHVARMVGIEIPILPQRGQIFHIGAMPPLLRRPLDALRQFPSGTVMVGTTNEFVGDDRTVTYETGARLLARAIRVVPALRGGRLLRARAGLRPMSPDALPISDAVPEVPGFYVAIGHSGITLAPLTGQVFLDLITTGQTPLPVDPHRSGRFTAADLAWAREPVKGEAHHQSRVWPWSPIAAGATSSSIRGSWTRPATTASGPGPAGPPARAPLLRAPPGLRGLGPPQPGRRAAWCPTCCSRPARAGCPSPTIVAGSGPTRSPHESLPGGEPATLTGWSQ